MKKGKIKSIIKTKRGIDKISIYFSFILVIISVLSVSLGLFQSITGSSFLDIGCWVSSLFEEEFYEADFELVNKEYLENNEDFPLEWQFEIEDKNILCINWEEYLKEDVNLDEVYPYLNRKLKDSKNLIFKNQGLYFKTKDEYFLVFYFNSDAIYIDLERIGSLSEKDATECFEFLYFTVIFESDIFDSIDNISQFSNNLIDNETISKYLLPIIFSNTKADMYKPVIYLYPEKEIDIDIILSGADLTTTYPQYNNGWSVTAYPDGTLIDKNGREYNYLYWEGKSDNFIDMSSGFVVSKDNYIDFLEEKLAYIGLTDKEACDFISYWLPQMNDYGYCQVSFQMENYEEQVKIDYSVEPDNELRVFATFKGLDNPIDIEEQDLSYYDNFKRND